VDRYGGLVRGAQRHLTGGTLLALGVLHLLWGRGSSFPFACRSELADAVIGRRTVPSSSACYGVAAALAVAAMLVEDAPPMPLRVRRVGLDGVAGVLALRGIVGLAGATALLSPGSVSPRFRRLDRRVYSPLCLALAAGALHSAADEGARGGPTIDLSVSSPTRIFTGAGAGGIRGRSWVCRRT
jgi:hypothetical protein